MKKVLLVIIDALASRVVVPAMRDWRLPMLARLAEVGLFREECTSVFPSITPAATASLVTGRYPAQHGIAGAFWYEREQNRIAYYGDDVWVIMNEGLGAYLHDFLIKLNYERLREKTLFEHIERAGLSAAVLNFMWFRGDCDHDLNAPLLLKLLPGVELAPRIQGPQITAMGDFVTSTLSKTGKPLSATGGIARRFGFHDETTADYLLELARHQSLPDFTLAYFPNNDFESHNHGPQQALATVERVDVILGTFVDLCGGLERCLEETVIVITGDHSQSDMAESASERGIDLNELLQRFQLVSAGKEWGDDDDIMVCPNLRAAQAYFRREPTDRRRDEVVAQILTEPRVDQLMWSERVREGRACRFHVQTSDRGRLAFQLARGKSEADCFDDFGNAWSVEGELSAIDARLTNERRIMYGSYPNALERLAYGFCEDCGDLWMTARPGSEFCVAETSIHPGGSHGSLHGLDSTSPLIAAGLPENIVVSEHPRTIDVAPLCLQVLNVPF